ncbi:hypothetical protein [Pseudonocardia parietis]|uniref:Uncharacterized protein n=1 Tax=Pseudonocardia parietis TaxID=570936 RepID=A0ABS4W5C7_9PSEU|nr:hypothetical protein [Pseudonocardia parietis]MBP2371365.1 hypothetical protein [Pseudonocardia parietis]
MTDELDPDPLLTINATPGVYAAQDRDGTTAVATLTLVPHLQVLTGDQRPGAEVVDAVLAALLSDGFALVPTLDVDALCGLPVLSGGAATFSPAAGLLELAAGMLGYDGDVGPAAPDGWASIAAQRGALAVLVATGIDLHAADRTARIDHARAEGRLIGAQVTFNTA